MGRRQRSNYLFLRPVRAQLKMNSIRNTNLRHLGLAFHVVFVAITQIRIRAVVNDTSRVWIFLDLLVFTRSLTDEALGGWHTCIYIDGTAMVELIEISLLFIWLARQITLFY